MKHSLACFFAVFVLGTSACSMKQNLQISDVTRAETVVLKKKATQGPIHGLSIVGVGSITGSAEVQLILHSSIYRKETISGSFRFELGGDWYSDVAEVRYIPSGVSSGSVTLTYDFKS